jgi:hypothetical protein
MTTRRVIMVDFILLVADEWAQRLPEIVAALDRVGAHVQLLDAKSCIIEGAVRSDRLQFVTRLKCAERVSMGATYVTEAPVPAQRGSRAFTRPIRRPRDVRRAQRPLTRRFPCPPRYAHVVGAMLETPQ